MDLITLLINLSASIDALKQQLVDAQAAAQAQYDKGFADGVASVKPGFSQADIDAAVAAAISPLNDQIASLQAQIDSTQSQIDAAVAAYKVQVQAAYAKEKADDAADDLAKLLA